MKKAKIVVLAGQSNAVGVGHVKYLPRYYDAETVKRFTEGYERILIRYISHNIENDKFEPVRINQAEKNKDTLGPEVGIARKLTEKYPDEEFFIIKCAFGGTNMHSDWRCPSSGVPYDPDMEVYPAKAISDPAFRHPGWCYNRLMKVLKEGFEELAEMGYEPEVIAFCWMQGESDCANPISAEPYIERYDALLRDVWESFAPAFDGCISVDAGISERWGSYNLMNDRKKAYAEEKGYRFVDTVEAGLTTKNEPEENPDVAHYDVESTVRLGEMFADNI